MKIGGQASNNGVVFYGENFKASFIMDKNNDYNISHSKIIQAKGFKSFLEKIPLIRGLAVLFGSPLPSTINITNIIIDIFGRSELSKNVDIHFNIIILIIAFAIALFCIAYILKKSLYKIKQVWKFHGAEHKTIYAVEHNIPLELENVRECPRVARRCGTNQVMFIILFMFVFGFFIKYISLRFILSFILAYELFDLKNGEKIPIINLLLKIGNWFQEKLFTSEPTDKQLLAAIDTVKKLIALEEQR